MKQNTIRCDFLFSPKNNPWVSNYHLFIYSFVRSLFIYLLIYVMA